MNIAFLGSNEILLERARRLGCYCLLIHEPDKVSQAALNLAHETYLGPPDPERICAWLRPKNIKTCASLSEHYLELCGQLNQLLNLDNGASLRLAKTTRLKSETRSHLEGTDLNIPYLVSDDLELVSDFMIRHKSLIAKPLKGVGSRGITRIETVELLKSFFETNHPQDFIFEKFVQGTEYSVETISQGGTHQIVGVTCKFLYPDSYVEQQQLAGSFDDHLRYESLVKAANELLIKLEVIDGVFHSEFIVEDGSEKVYSIECHNRVGGCSIPELWHLRTGYDLYTEYIRLTLGLPVRMVPDHKDSEVFASSYYFSREKLMSGFQVGTEYLRCASHIADFRLFPKRSDDRNDIASSGDRPGYFVIHARNKTDYEKLMEQTLNNLYLRPRLNDV